jgi:hypothetical protein
VVPKDAFYRLWGAEGNDLIIRQSKRGRVFVGQRDSLTIVQLRVQIGNVPPAPISYAYVLTFNSRESSFRWSPLRTVGGISNMRKSLWIIALLFAATVAPKVRADVTTYQVTLTGPGESPPNATPGTGFAVITIDINANTLNIVSYTFTGLTSPATASHIQCCTAFPGVGTAGVATQVPSFVGFPLGVTSGTYSMSFDMTQASTWNPTFITANGGTPGGAELALAAGAAAGEAYLNIHTNDFPGGEIRGFLTPTPEPASLLLFGTGLLGIMGAARRKWLG